MLKGYGDHDYITNGFENGFYLNFFGTASNLNSLNSPSTFMHREQVMKKLREETTLGRISGPYDFRPFNPFKISPLAIIEKKIPGKYRLIHNLSYPYNEDSISIYRKNSQKFIINLLIMQSS